MFRLILLTVIMSATVASAIEVDGIQREHTPIVVTHEPGELINILHWRDGQPMLLDPIHLVRRETETTWAAPTGTYVVIREGSAVVVVTSNGLPEPEPKPEPEPEPKPPDPEPAPVPDGIMAKWLVVIEEQAERGQHADFFNRLLSQSTMVLLNDLGIRFRIYDDDQPEAAPFVRAAGDHKPALILMTEDGQEVRVTGAVDDIEAWIRENIVR